ncbi:MAG: ABC transporter permease [Calditrichaeota bacterium]|nr:ABC transporter permease [Calditrichota bacterium]
MNYLFELIKIATTQLTANKMRSFLTTLGIILGVWFVISIVSIMDAFTANLLASSAGLGPDVFQVDRYPRNQGRRDQRRFNPRIDKSVSKRLMEKCPHVLIAAAEDSKNSATLTYLDRKTNSIFTLYGAQKGFQLNNNWPIDRGRDINDDDNLSNRNVIVLGYAAVKELFYDRDPMGEYVKIDGKSYKVIGIMKEQGNQFGQNRDVQAAIPLNTLHRDFGESDRVRVTVRATAFVDRFKAIDEVRNEMRLINKDGPTEPDSFGIWTNESSAEGMTNVLNMTTLGGSILGLIALFVGGIGVMNIMLASVKERTKEIGIRKSLGAKKRTILFQFIFESSFLCLFGCFIGLVVGIFTGWIVSFFFGNPPVLPYGATLTAIIATSFIGIGFGTYPAWKAARLDPIEALRYE